MLARNCKSAQTTKASCFRKDDSGLKRFPMNNFTYCLTLFPKFFSPFDHSTCALSVSCQYLALDGIYHPFRAAFPNNSTLRSLLSQGYFLSLQTGLSPYIALCSNRLEWRILPKKCLAITIRTWVLHARFQIWALSTSLAVTMDIPVGFFSSAYWYA